MAWENANTYAPWATPNGTTGYNPSFGGYGQGDPGNVQNLMGSPFEGSTWQAWFDNDLSSKKRSSPNFYAPSYQGYMFTPQEGFPEWYTNGDASDDWMGSSYQGLANNQLIANQLPRAPQPNQNQNQSLNMGASGVGGNSALGSDPFLSGIYGNSPAFGGAGTQYVPQYGASYGGYDSYGGFAASNNKPSTYQPFVPTGYGMSQY